MLSVVHVGMGVLRGGGRRCVCGGGGGGGRSAVVPIIECNWSIIQNNQKNIGKYVPQLFNVIGA